MVLDNDVKVGHILCDDDFILLTNNENKSYYITNVSSIFVDDSFAERKEVLDKLHIFRFSLGSVGALLLWNVSFKSLALSYEHRIFKKCLGQKEGY